MMPRSRIASFFALAPLLAAPSALAQDAPPLEQPAPPPASAPAPTEPVRFGAPGQIVLTSGLTLGGSSLRWDNTDASTDSIGGALGFDWFFLRNLSLGIDLEGNVTDHKGYAAGGTLTETRSTLISGGPRLGLNLPLGDSFSIYPRVTLGFHHATTDVTGAAGSTFGANGAPAAPTIERTGAWVEAYVPLLLHAPHFFVGFGPRVYHDFAAIQGGPLDGNRRTELGAELTVGGWFGGPEGEARETEAAPGTTRPKRFGDDGVVVLTGETSLSVESTSYSQSDASSSTFSLTPGVDYFVADHLSLGVGFTYATSSSRGIDPQGNATTSSTSSFGIAPRLGVEAPLGKALSLYPRAGVGFGGGSFDETAGTKENKYSWSSTWVSLSVPLLVHPARHFFVGFGPYVTHDLSRSFDFGGSNQGTTVGASAMVGGWL